MLFKVENNFKCLTPLQYRNISDQIGKNEKDLENLLKELIGDVIFPDLLVFGNERNYQSEADLFALDRKGNLVVIEIKVGGLYDSDKIYQALRYAQEFSSWNYEKMNEHYKKCFLDNSCIDLKELFIQNFGKSIDTSEYNKNQQIIIISNASALSIADIVGYWRNQGIDIKEYYYRYYTINGEIIFELSNDIYLPQNERDCWINTCKSFYPEAYIDMIKNKKASAYGNRSFIINSRIRYGHIFLYHNGYGIIACGVGTAKFENKETNGFTKGVNESAIYLKDFKHGVNLETGKISEYISIEEIKNELNQNIFFANTLVSLTRENAEKLMELCNNRFSN